MSKVEDFYKTPGKGKKSKSNEDRHFELLKEIAHNLKETTQAIRDLLARMPAPTNVSVIEDIQPEMEKLMAKPRPRSRRKKAK